MVALAIGVAIGCTGIGASLAVPFQGADLVESLTDGVLATALNTATGYASTQIGQARVGEIGERGGKKVLVSGGLDGFTHKLLHALNGAALGAAVSRGKDVVASAAAGAIGAVGAELIGEYLMEDVIGRGHEPAVLREKLQQRADIAKLAATTGALVTGHDPAIASSAAETAVRHNCARASLALATLYEKKIETIISGVEATGEVLATKIEPLAKINEAVHERISEVESSVREHPIVKRIPGAQFRVDLYGKVAHMGVDLAIPTDVLGVGLTLPVVVGAVTKGASAAVQAGKQLVMGVERGLGRVLAVGVEALGESDLLLESLGRKIPSLSRGVSEISSIRTFAESTASSAGKMRVKPFSTSTPTASSPTIVMMESTEFIGSKVKPGPISARERARAYSEKLRQEMKAMPKPFTSAPKPMSVTSSASPPSAAATQRFEGVGYGAHFDYSTPEAAYSLAIEPITRKGPMSIDSRLFTSGTPTAKGGIRNKKQFWQLWEQKYPGMLSAKNLKEIKKGLSPEVDSHWVEYFPEHQRYIGQTLEHHHIDHGFFATPLPYELHRGKGNKLKWHE